MRKLIILGCAILLLASCAAHKHEPINADVIYGFWFGLWHGIISPITFIISLFNDNVVVWETHNNGGWYTFGFLLGVGGLGSSTTSSKK